VPLIWNTEMPTRHCCLPSRLVPSHPCLFFSTSRFCSFAFRPNGYPLHLPQRGMSYVTTLLDERSGHLRARSGSLEAQPDCRHRYPTGQSDHQIAVFPLSFLHSCGDNTWQYVLYVVNLLVDQIRGHPGRIVITDDVNAIDDALPVDFQSSPTAGTYYCIQDGWSRAISLSQRIIWFLILDSAC
jgi:hypothetical protein